MSNAIKTILENQGFVELTEFTTIDSMKVKYTLQKDNLRFIAIEFTYTSDKVNYILENNHNKFGFMSQTYIVWESYSECLEQLKEALKWIN